MLVWAHEAKLSAEEAQARPDTRIPRTSQNEDRTTRPSAPHAKGSHAPRRVMPSRFRLTRADFAGMRNFQRLHGRFFSLSFGELPGRGPGAACVVSKKVAAKAVDRNRIKRRCRAVLSKHVGSGRSIFVVIAKKGVASASFADVSSDIESLIARATKRGV